MNTATPLQSLGLSIYESNLRYPLLTHYSEKMLANVQWFYYWPLEIFSPGKFPLVAVSTVIVEACILRFAGVFWKRSFITSLAANLLSFQIGLMLIGFSRGRFLPDADETFANATHMWRAFAYCYVITIVIESIVYRVLIKRATFPRLFIIAVIGNALTYGLAVVLTWSDMQRVLGQMRPIPEFLLDPPQIPVPPFQLKITLSEAATQKLHVTGETVAGSIVFDGSGNSKQTEYIRKPGPLSWLPMATPSHPVVVGSYEFRTSGTEIVSVNDASISQEAFGQLSDQDYYCTVNVFSGRRAFSGNILDCGNADVKISEAVKQPIEVTCDVIR